MKEDPHKYYRKPPKPTGPQHHVHSREGRRLFISLSEHESVETMRGNQHHCLQEKDPDRSIPPSSVRTPREHKLSIVCMLDYRTENLSTTLEQKQEETTNIIQV